jgi:purine-nucleoside phosphorylase
VRNALQSLREYRAETAIVLGSGLSSLVESAADAEKIPYAAFPEIPRLSVPGHVGQFVRGKIDPPSPEATARLRSHKIIFAQGRVHLYEGFSAREVTSVVRVLAEAGIKQLILTNAAGALNPKFKPGDWMMITDHINLTGTSPLMGSAVEAAVPGGSSASRFVDLTDAYSTLLREKFRAAASKIDMTLHEGVYAGSIGPQYETPAEVNMLRSLGADAVGMSTVLETIQARARYRSRGFFLPNKSRRWPFERKTQSRRSVGDGKKSSRRFCPTPQHFAGLTRTRSANRSGERG